MSVKIRCPSCQSVHAVHARMLGKQIKCPSCDGQIQVPSAEQIESAKQSANAAKLAAGPRIDFPQSMPTVKPLVTAQLAATTDAADDEKDKNLSSAITSFKRPKAPPQEDMDMTPMVDVTFLLLIFFMITASFSVQKSIQQPAQKSDEPSRNVKQNEEDKDSLIIQIDEFNAYNVIISGVDSPAGSKQDLIVKLTDFQAGTNAGERATKLVVDAHENCIHSAVVDALDAGREAGFENFEVRTVEQFD
jgi:biopolymer transport protein ExbD